MSFYFALACRVFRVSVPHYAFSFNHGNGRFLKGIRGWLAKRVFKDVKGLMVPSTQEKKIYGDYYGIPSGKFMFSHWAINPPVVGGDVYELEKHRPYVCSIGRNNRDFDTFIGAVERLGINGVIVCRKGSVDPTTVPDSVKVLSDIPMDSAMKVLSLADVSVTLLRDASTGAGHITIVHGMQLGVPQLLTYVTTVEDYFVDGEHGYYVEQNNVDSLVSKLSILLTDHELRDKFSRNCQGFAERWLMEDSSRRSLTYFLEQVGSGKGMPTAPPGWS